MTKSHFIAVLSLAFAILALAPTVASAASIAKNVTYVRTPGASLAAVSGPSVGTIYSSRSVKKLGYTTNRVTAKASGSYRMRAYIKYTCGSGSWRTAASRPLVEVSLTQGRTYSLGIPSVAASCGTGTVTALKMYTRIWRYSPATGRTLASSTALFADAHLE